MAMGWGSKGEAMGGVTLREEVGLSSWRALAEGSFCGSRWRAHTPRSCHQPAGRLLSLPGLPHGADEAPSPIHVHV